MKIEIINKNFQMSDQLRSLITEKVEKLDRYFTENASVNIVCSKVKETQKLELTIKDEGMLFRSEVISDDMYKNIDLALKKLERQVVKFSSKNQDKIRRPAKELLLFNEEAADLTPEDYKITKSKNFAINPLTPDEAVMELENSDHSFYVFINSKNGKVNIIYKRYEGNYGLLDPEYD